MKPGSCAFDVVQLSPQRSGICPVCRKTVRRQRTFWQSVNPWNRNADGTTKTAREVYESVAAESAAWVPDFTHGKCGGQA